MELNRNYLELNGIIWKQISKVYKIRLLKLKCLSFIVTNL